MFCQQAGQKQLPFGRIPVHVNCGIIAGTSVATFRHYPHRVGIAHSHRRNTHCVRRVGVGELQQKGGEADHARRVPNAHRGRASKAASVPVVGGVKLL